VASLLPSLLVGQPLVWQARETEAAIGDPDPAGVVTQHFGRDVYQRALFGFDHGACPLTAVHQH
jgi:hypothetical protein